MSHVVGVHVDGGSGVGLGHVSRGVGLAAALRARDCEPIFLVPEGSEIDGYLRRSGERVAACSPAESGLLAACAQVSAGALVIDSYRIGTEELARIAHGGVVLVCFDDTAEREFVADLIVNGSPAALALPYRARVGCRYLLGPAYQIVRPQFVPDVARDHGGPPATVLATVGGDDPLHILDDLIAFFGSWLAARGPESRVDVVVGPFVARTEDRDVPVGLRLHDAPRDLRTLMIGADVAVSAGGQTLYELARCGTPTVAVCVAADQARNLEALGGLRAIEYVGWARSSGWIDRVDVALMALWRDARERTRMAQTAAQLFDGLGASRVADGILTLLRQRSPAEVRGCR